MSQSSPAKDYADLRVRPLLWRIPLLAVVAIGLTCLTYLDGLLVRESVNEATTQAVQTDALLESFLRHRFALIHNERALVAPARSTRESRERFEILAAQILEDASDVVGLYLLDSTGAVTEAFQRDGERLPAATGNHFRVPERADALFMARNQRRPAVTRSVAMSSGARGMIVYVPVVRATRVVGYIGGAFAYQALFNDALAGQLQGSFSYRISDPLGEVIAVSADFPERPASLIARDVTIPGGSRWKLDVAVPPFQPLVARLATWTVGLMLVVVVVFLVLREEARARRFAAHSYDLELMSSDLLDANVRLEERSQQIAEANRAKSRFLANVSHELRTPLNAIVGYNSLAIDGIYGDAPPPLRSAHQRIKAAAEHLLALVNDVLDLSKIEVGRMQVDSEIADVGALVDTVVTVIEPIVSVKGLALHVVVARDLPRITTDPRHVRQILLNLATNAVKFTERGAVTVSARRSDGGPNAGVTITVDDTGMGIAGDDLDRIFEEFEQVRPSGRGDSLERGTGLGLAISRKLARLLGGDIEVTSVVGRGSRFSLHIPLQSPPVSTDGSHVEGVGPRQSIDASEASPSFGSPALHTEQGDSDEHAAYGIPRARAGLDDDAVGG